MNSHKILVLGGGFAGLWSAVGAARMLDKLGLRSEKVTVRLVNADPFHCIRVRNYEADLRAVRVPLDDVLGPVGVQRVEGHVTGIDLANQQVQLRVAGAGGLTNLEYDRLVLALGSQLNRPNIPGLEKYSFDVDTYAGAVRLDAHLQSLPTQCETPGLYSVVIVGAGLTGIETATEMPARLRAILATAQLKRPLQVILVDHNPWVGSDMGNSARPVIEQALRDLAIETRTGVSIASIDGSGVTLESGTVIPAATVVWCGGMQANPLTREFPVEHDRFGRLPVDEFMKVKGVANVFAAGDVASAMMDDTHTSVMSCQHARPMGRFAGHNVVCDLLKQPMRPLRIEWYVTVLDLGPWGAVYTQGWERAVVSVGAAAKRTKQTINCHRIYPPLTKNRREILDAAEPIVQTPPEFCH